MRGGEFCLPLAGIIDIAGESARLNKAIAKLEAELTAMSAKLNNETFMSKAPDTVIEQARARLEEGRIECDSLQKAAARIAALA